MKKIITALLMTSSLSVSANNAEFTTMQLQQVDEVRTAALKSHLSYELLESLTTEVGPRLPGTENDKKAVAWAKAKFNELGFDKVWLEEATFPKWRRYSESGKILTPSEQHLHLTALGNSVSTPDDGISAPVVLFETLDELIAAPANSLEGKIAYINYRMNRDIDGNGYGPAVKARATGAIEAAKKGAVAYMMRIK
jgi:hypothetical protein